MAMALTLAAPASAQKTLHRHNPKIVNDANTAPDGGITAYSDTTAATTAVTDSTDAATDAAYYDATDVDAGAPMAIGDVPDPFRIIAYLSNLGGWGGVLIAVLVVLLCMLTVLSPAIIIGLILYFVQKSRNRKYKIIEKAVESGQPIPQELVRENKTTNDRLWAKGIKNAAVGLGIVVFGFLISASFFTGVGWIVFFYGAGQAVVARTTAGGRRRNDDRPFMDDIKDDNRNGSEV